MPYMHTQTYIPALTRRLCSDPLGVFAWLVLDKQIKSCVHVAKRLFLFMQCGVLLLLRDEIGSCGPSKTPMQMHRERGWKTGCDWVRKTWDWKRKKEAGDQNWNKTGSNCMCDLTARRRTMGDWREKTGGDCSLMKLRPAQKTMRDGRKKTEGDKASWQSWSWWGPHGGSVLQTLHSLGEEVPHPSNSIRACHWQWAHGEHSKWCTPRGYKFVDTNSPFKCKITSQEIHAHFGTNHPP